jgi:DNA repair protein RecN (Recombination protein N)
MQAEFDFNLFQFNELSNASLNDNAEQELLEAELKMLENAEELQLRLNDVLQILQLGEVNGLSLIKAAQIQMQALAKKMPQVEIIVNRLLDLREQMIDISSEAEVLLNKIENNPERADEIQQRLNTIYSLQKKHRVQDVESLIQIQNRLEATLNQVSQLDEEILQLEKERNQLFDALMQSAKSLSTSRNKAIPPFEKQLKQLLKSVGMPNTDFKVQSELLEADNININGLDKIEFLFTANKGFQAQSLQKMASGGELSRLMLCIKSIIAKSVSLPTLVFDEIDNGISGETAQQVGLLMKQIAEAHQVICITHLPQMAAKADTHFYIYKEQKQDKTTTRIKQLDEQERVVEIAKMLSGENPGRAALQNAKELIDL